MEARYRQVVTDDLGHHEVEELLGELGIKLGLGRKSTEPRDLLAPEAALGGVSFNTPTCWVNLKRSASRCTKAASMLSMLSRRRSSSPSTRSSTCDSLEVWPRRRRRRPPGLAATLVIVTSPTRRQPPAGCQCSGSG